MAFTRAKSNGQNADGAVPIPGGMGMPTESGGAGQGIFGDGVLEEFLSNPQAANLAKHFVSPGDNIRELLMRLDLTQDKQARALVMYVYQCRECDDKEGEEMALDFAAALTSIKSGRISLLAKVLMRGADEFQPRSPVEKIKGRPA
jgi:hypothetical protein